MYQYPVRPNRGGRQLFAPLKPSRSRSQRGIVPTLHIFLQSSLFEANVFRAFALALATVGVITSLSACGGVSYRSQSTTGGSGNNATSPALTGISCATLSLTGDQSSSCTATLSGAATSATSVTLASNNSALQVPSTVTIASGATTASFKAVASAVSKTTSVTISGTADGLTKTDILTLNPQNPGTLVSLSRISCATLSLTGGESSSCTATLSGSASSATKVTLASSNAALEVPSTVTIAAGASTGDFKAVASAVSKTTSVTISGDAYGVTKTDILTLNPESTGTIISLSSISCGTQSLTGAQSKSCTATLTGTASSATSVTLASSSSALQVPSTVKIAAGAASAGFNAVSTAVSKATSVTLSGSADGVTKTDVITVYPQATTVASLTKLTCASLSLTGVTTTACLVSLSSAPTSPVQILLSSNNKSLVVPGSVTVPTGLTTAAFVATSLAVTTTQNAILTAKSNGVSQTSVLQLNGILTTSTQYQVQLSWNAATSSSVTITGYNVYRSLSGSSYQLLNNSPNATTNYTDATVQNGQTYDYIVTTVDSAGAESSPSNQTSITIP